MQKGHWWEPSDVGWWGPQVLFCWFLFCGFFSTIFIPLWPFCTYTWEGPHHQISEGPHQFLFHQFLFHSFCSADLFALALGVPTTQCPRVPTKFYSTMTFLCCPHQFLFHSFCSAVLFCWPYCTCTWDPHHPMSEGSPTIFILLFLFCCFWSAVFVPLTFLYLYFGVPKGSHQFLFHWPFYTCTWGPHYPMFKGPHQFLFCCFCSTVFVLQFLFCSFCSTDLLALALEVPEGAQFLFHSFWFHCPFCSCTWCPKRVPTNFYSTVLVLQFLFHWPFCTCTWGLQGSPPIFILLFVFCSYCSADLFALALGFPTTQCPRVPTNFYSTMTFLHYPHQFLFHCFCSAVLFCWPYCTCTWDPHHPMSEGPPIIFILLDFYSAVFVLLFWSAVFVPLTFLYLYLGSLRVPNNFCSTDLFTLALEVPKGPHQFLFHWPFALALEVPKGPHKFLFHCFCSTDLFALALRVPSSNIRGSPLIFILLFLFCCFCSTVFVLLFLFCWPFCTCTWGPQGSPTIFVLLCLFRYFNSADLFALALGVPITQCPRVPTNFYSTVSVPQFLFHCFCFTDLFALALRVPVTQCPMVSTNFYSTMTFLHCTHQFLFHCFCSAVFILLTFLHLQLFGGPRHLATQYIMHTNILNIQNPKWSQN